MSKTADRVLGVHGIVMAGFSAQRKSHLKV